MLALAGAPAAGVAQEGAAQEGAAQQQGPAEFLQSFVWTSGTEAEIGGLSGFDMADDGAGFAVLSDRNGLAQGRLLRDAQGRITAVDSGPFMPLLHADPGKSLGRYAADSEGLAMAADGSLYVSFEGYARIWRYPRPGAQPLRVPRPQEFNALRGNRGLESLAVDVAGALYTMPEVSAAPGAPFPVYRLRGNRWDRPFDLPRIGGWQVAGADFGPDGRLYLLERDYKGIWGFTSQIRRFALTGDKPDGGEVVMRSGPGRHDNLEGIAVWRDTAGRLRATMVSDDNFRLFQRTEFVEYALPD